MMRLTLLDSVLDVVHGEGWWGSEVGDCSMLRLHWDTQVWPFPGLCSTVFFRVC